MKIVATEKAPKALGPYSQGYVHNGVLYTAGQIAINPEVNDVEATTIEAQTEQVCKNLGEVLKEAGTSFSGYDTENYQNYKTSGLLGYAYHEKNWINLG